MKKEEGLRTKEEVKRYSKEKTRKITAEAEEERKLGRRQKTNGRAA